MAVKIRLTRLGDKKTPFYRVIVADSRSPRDGRFIDILGTYNPLVDPAEIKIDAEKAKKWISNGAKPTEAQARTIQKELKRACNIRSACHATSIGVSLALLGIIVPLYTRHKTKKKHAEALKLAQEKTQTTQNNETQKEPVTPLNVKYNKLTAGFRADTKLAR